jgi:hypothetical protein
VGGRVHDRSCEKLSLGSSADPVSAPAAVVKSLQENFEFEVKTVSKAAGKRLRRYGDSENGHQICRVDPPLMLSTEYKLNSVQGTIREALQSARSW